MTEFRYNRTPRLFWFVLCAMLVLFGIRMVANVIYNPFGAEGDKEANWGIFMILAGLILPFFLFPKSGNHSEMASDENQ